MDHISERNEKSIGSVKMPFRCKSHLGLAKARICRPKTLIYHWWILGTLRVWSNQVIHTICKESKQNSWKITKKCLIWVTGCSNIWTFPPKMVNIAVALLPILMLIFGRENSNTVDSRYSGWWKKSAISSFSAIRNYFYFMNSMLVVWKKWAI